MGETICLNTDATWKRPSSRLMERLGAIEQRRSCRRDHHVMPAGVFQPSSVMPWDQSNDFNLWRNVLREYAEEFFGDPEADGSRGAGMEIAESNVRGLLENEALASAAAACLDLAWQRRGLILG
ncbi:hypothetical protein ACFWNQ_20935 [Streptomyces virginiae]|uniref:hypothetical protein n=1 Tax=Streptomyces virginiae TaxID=1961 RepID=UPI00364A1053